MAVRPISFTGPMVSAILDGRKTQTRRVLKPQPEPWRDYHLEGGCQSSDWSLSTGFYTEDGEHHQFGLWMHCAFHESRFRPLPCAPGDLLWVKEAWAKVGDGPDDIHACPDLRCHAYYRVGSTNAEQQRWRSSRYMPRWASRITLRVTDVRVQQVQDISDEDARAEGCVESYEIVDVVQRPYGPQEIHDDRWRVPGVHDDYETSFDDAGLCYADIWDSINAKHGHGWEANPWVAAYTFEPILKNVDEVVTDD